MAHYGLLKGAQVGESVEDIRGSHLYGMNDDKLGKIDDVIFDHSSGDIRYAVVDTGGWLSSKKFIVPTEQIRSSSRHEGDFEAALTKQQIESFPPYRESDLDSENHWGDYEGRYRSKWVSDPVMHRAETDRNITPTTYQATGNINSETAEAQAHGMPRPTRSYSQEPNRGLEQADLQAGDLEAAESPTERGISPADDAVVISTSAAGIGGRWDTFQSRLRERRKEAVVHCSTCTGQSATKRGADSTDTLRKAG